MNDINLPDREPSMPAEQQGLFNKFIVRRTDGTDAPGGKHHGCRYFVLDVDHDRHAAVALGAYADACQSTHPALARDLREKWNAGPSRATGDGEAGAVPVYQTRRFDGSWVDGSPQDYDDEEDHLRRIVYAAPPAQPEKQAGQELSVSLTGAELADALEYVAPDRDPDQMEAVAVIRYGDGHSGKGYYCWLDDYPEEGAILLGSGFAAPPAPSQQAAPGAEPTMPKLDTIQMLRNGHYQLLEILNVGLAPNGWRITVAPPAAESAEPVATRPETISEHISRDILEGRFPQRSEPQMIPIAATADAQACDGCHGSGESTTLSGGGPDAYDVPILCPQCGGTGATADAQCLSASAGHGPTYEHRCAACKLGPCKTADAQGDERAIPDEHRDINFWKIVDSDMREGEHGLITYHVAAFKAGALSRQPSAPASAVDYDFLRRIITEMDHCRIFVSTREKIHPDGLRLYDELREDIFAAAALAAANPEGGE